MVFFYRLMQNPWTHMGVGFLMIILSGFTLYDGFVYHASYHHLTVSVAVFILGALLVVEAMNFLLAGSIDVAEGVEEMPQHRWPLWLYRLADRITESQRFAFWTAMSLLAMGAVDAFRLLFDEHYESLPTAFALTFLGLSMVAKILMSTYATLAFEQEHKVSAVRQRVHKRLRVFLNHPWMHVATGVVIVVASVWEEGVMVFDHLQTSWEAADSGMLFYGVFYVARFLPKAWDGVDLVRATKKP